MSDENGGDMSDENGGNGHLAGPCRVAEGPCVSAAAVVGGERVVAPARQTGVMTDQPSRLELAGIGRATELDAPPSCRDTHHGSKPEPQSGTGNVSTCANKDRALEPRHRNW